MPHAPPFGWLAGEAVALTALVSAFLQFLPDIAAGFAACWYLAMLIDWTQKRQAKRAELVIEAAAQAAKTVLDTAAVTAKNLKDSG